MSGSRYRSFVARIKNLSFLSLTGLGVLWAWLNAVNGPLMLGQDEPSSDSGLIALIWRIALVIGLLVLGLNRRDIHAYPRYRAIVVLMIVCGTAGTALLVVRSIFWHVTSVMYPLLLVGSVLIGLTYALSLKTWADNNNGLDFFSIIISFAVSIIISALLFHFLNGLPKQIAQVALIVLPVVLGFCQIPEPDNSSRYDSLDSRRQRAGWRMLPLLACVMLLGATYGILDSSVSLIFKSDTWSYGNALLGCLMLLWLFFRKAEIDPAALLIVVSILVCIGIVTASFFLEDYAFSSIIVSAGLLSILMVAILASSLTSSQVIFISSKRFCLNLALFFSSLMVLSWLSYYLTIARTTALTLSTALLVAATASVAFLRSRNEDRADSSQSEASDAFSSACHMLSKSAHLTKRESDILVLLAKGHTIKSVASKFTVSPSTIKTQTHSVYTKLGVHTRQDLIDLVERRAQETSDCKPT